jgi:hypothetical protein
MDKKVRGIFNKKRRSIFKWTYLTR